MIFQARCLIVLGFVLFASSLGAEENPLWRFVHPNAKALVGIQWSRVQESEVGHWIQRRWIKGLALPGAEFLQGVEEVLISSPGVTTEVADGKEQGGPALVIAIRGHFNLALVEAVMVRQGSKKQMFGKVALWRPRIPTGSDPVFAIVNSEIILAGDLQPLFSTIERSQTEWAGQESDPFLKRARVLAHRYDCWALMRDNGAMRNFLFASLAGKTLSPDSQGFEAGITVRDGFVLDVTLKVRTEKAARTLQTTLNALLQTAAHDRPESGGFSSLLNKMRVTVDSSKVFLSIRMSNADLARTLNPLPKPEQRTMATASIAPRPPANLTIKIEGLDDGPREVPFRE